MTEREPIYLQKAEESLAGAVSEFISGRYNNAGNRAYYAAYQAAVYAVEGARFAPEDPRGRWSHEAVQSVFARGLITRRKLYPAVLRAVLQRNFLVRQSADYGRDLVSEVQASRAIDRTREFLRAIATRGGGRQ